MKCQKCGTMLPDNFKFCIKCGNKLTTDTQPGQAAPETVQGKPHISERHFSLEDIAHQQEEKNDIGFSSIAAAADNEADHYDEYNPDSAPPLDGTKKTSQKSSGRKSSDNIPLYSIRYPAIPSGDQIQTCFSIFGSDASQKIEAFKKNK